MPYTRHPQNPHIKPYRKPKAKVRPKDTTKHVIIRCNVPRAVLRKHTHMTCHDGIIRPIGNTTIIRPEVHPVHPMNRIRMAGVIGRLLDFAPVRPAPAPLPDALPDWLTPDFGKAKRKA